MFKLYQRCSSASVRKSSRLSVRNNPTRCGPFVRPGWLKDPTPGARIAKSLGMPTSFVLDPRLVTPCRAVSIVKIHLPGVVVRRVAHGGCLGRSSCPPSLASTVCRGRKRMIPKDAVEPTQRRKGAKTQGFHLLGTFTRQVSNFRPVFPSPFPCLLRLCLLASLRLCAMTHARQRPIPVVIRRL